MADEEGSTATNPRGPLTEDAAGVALDQMGLLADDPDFGIVEDVEGQDPEEGDVGDEDLEEEEFEEVPERDLEDPDDFEEESPDELTDEEDVEAEDEASDDELYTVKVDGEELEVTLDEALAGYQRTAAFTRKAQELAREREAVRERQQELANEQQQYLDKLQVVQRALQVEEPDWSQIKAERGEDEYARLRAQYDERRQQLQAIESEMQETRQELLEQQQQQRQEIREREKELLLAERPEWMDPEKAKSAAERLHEGAMNEYGFSHEEFENALDHRVYLMLDDALKYREMQSKSSEAKKEARAKRRKSRTLKPGSSTTKSKKSSREKKAAAARNRLAQTGRHEDAAEALDHILPDDII